MTQMLGARLRRTRRRSHVILLGVITVALAGVATALLLASHVPSADAAASVSCSFSNGTATVTVNGGSTNAGSSLYIQVLQFEDSDNSTDYYELNVTPAGSGGTVVSGCQALNPNSATPTQVVGTATGDFDSIAVVQQGGNTGQSQYVQLDDGNGLMAGLSVTIPTSSGTTATTCPIASVQLLAGTSSASGNAVELDTYAGTTVSATSSNLSMASSCSSSQVALTSSNTNTVQSVFVYGSGSQSYSANNGNTLSFSGSTNELTIAANTDSSSSLGSVTGFTSGTITTFKFADEETLDGSTSEATDFQPGSVTGVNFDGLSGSDYLDLSQESGSRAPVFAATDASEGLLTGSSASTSEVDEKVLKSISCAAPSGATFCAAVDGVGNVVVSSNGTSWSSAQSIDPGVTINSLSCVNSSFCVAVDASGNALLYDGTSWASTSIDAGNSLTGVSCVSSSFCVAVDNGASNGNKGNVVVYSGSTPSWGSPTQEDTQSFESVSCFSTNYCVATDSHGNVEIYSGSTPSWAASPTNVDGGNALEGISCASTSNCAAVDNHGNVVYTTDGWNHVINTSDVDGSTALDAISCPSTSFCAAVDADGNSLVTTNFWSSGTTKRDIDGSLRLNGVSCTASTFCAAVDDESGVLSYNGTSWSASVAVDGSLDAISCTSSSFCATVDGTGTAITYSPTTAAQADAPNRLTAVDCLSTISCVAVDASGHALTYNGTWSAPDDIDGSNDLTAVSCAATTTPCVAVDAEGDAFVYTGSSWTEYSDIDPHPLEAISCAYYDAAISFCVATDNHGNVVEVYTDLGSLVTYQGPTDVDGTSDLTGISCANYTSCIAVDADGNAVDGDPFGTWSAPEDIDAANQLDAISCASTSSCAAVDDTGNIVTYNGSSWTARDIDGTIQLDSISCPTTSFCAAVDGTNNVVTYSQSVSDTYTGIATVLGAPVGTEFSVDASSGSPLSNSVTFDGWCAAPAPSNILDLTNDSASSTVTVTAAEASPASSSIPAGETSDYACSSGSEASASVTVGSFGVTAYGIDQISGSKNTTDFQVGTATTPLTFIGQSGGDYLDLSDVTTSSGESTVSVGVTSAGGTVKATTSGGSISDSFSGIANVLGSPSGSDFEVGGDLAASVNFLGYCSPIQSNVLGLGSVTQVSTVAMSSSTGTGVPSSDSANYGCSAAAASDPLSGGTVTAHAVTLVKGSTTQATTFQPGSASGVTYEGQSGSDVLALTQASAYTVAVNGDSTTSPGTFAAGGSTQGSFEQVANVQGPTDNPTDFQPGSSSTTVTFTGGTGSSAINVLDLSQETASLAVDMTGAGGNSSEWNGKLLSGTGSTLDTVQNVSDVLGSSGGTTFQPGSTTATFYGYCSTSAPTNILDLSLTTAAPSPDVSVAMSESSPTLSGLTLPSGVLSHYSCAGAEATATGGSTDTAFAVTQVDGSSSSPTDFQPGNATTSVTFVGGTSGTNVVDLSGVTTTSTVDAGANSAATPGTITVGSVNDSFYGISQVLGSQAGTDWEPVSSSIEFFGWCTSPTPTNVLDLGNASSVSGISVTMAETAPPAPPAAGSYPSWVTAAHYDCDEAQGTVGASVAYDVAEVKGSTSSATDYSPGNSTGVTFVGQGSGPNTLDLSGEGALYTVNMVAGTFGVGTDSTAQGSFSQVDEVKGTPDGTNFEAATTGGVTFVGNPSSESTNTLTLPSSSSLLTVSVGSDSSGSPGSVTGLSTGFSSTSDSFSGIGVFAANSGGGGTTFDADQVGASPTEIVYEGAGTGTNTLSFAPLNENTGALSIDVVTDLASIATEGGPIASFSGIQDFVACDSPTSGPNGCPSTTFYAGSLTTDYSFAGSGTSNTLDFSALPSPGSGVTVTEASGAGTATTGSTGALGFTGVQAINGSKNADLFNIESGNIGIAGGGGQATVSLANDTAGAIKFQLGEAVVGSSTVETTTIQTGNGTDTATDIPIFVGSSAGQNTFVSDGFGGHTFEAGGTGNVLDLSQQSVATSALSVNVTGSCSPLPDCVKGLQSNLATTFTPSNNAAVDFFSGIQTFDGASSGTTFLSNGTTGLAFNGGSATSDVLDLSAAPSGTQVNDDECDGSVIAGSGTETFSSIAQVKGSTGGSTTFVVSSGDPVIGATCGSGAPSGETFVGQGSGNKLDISAIPTTTNPVALVMPEGVTAGCVAETADLGATGTCPASTSSELETFVDIQGFTGSTQGSTSFVSGSTGGFTFTGQGTGNVLSFEDIAAQAGGIGGVQVFLNPNSQSQEIVDPGSGSDAFTGITTIDGTPNDDTFSGGPGNYTLYGDGGSDELNDSSATNGVQVVMDDGGGTVTGGFSGTTTTTAIQTFVGSAEGGNNFEPDGYLGYTFEAPGSSSGSNTLTFAGVEASTLTSLDIDVTTSSGNGTVSCGSGPTCTTATDTFQGIQDYVGSDYTNDFASGNGSFDFTGGGTSNTLDLSAATAGVTFNVSGTTQSSPTGTATSANGKVDDVISGFSTLLGSSLGSNDFQASVDGGYDLVGEGAANVLDLSTEPGNVTVAADGASGPADVVSGLTAGFGGHTTDSYTDIEQFDGSQSSTASHPTTFLVNCGNGQAFDGQGSGSILSISYTGCATGPSSNPSPTIDAAVSPGTITGLPGNSGEDTFTDISTFDAASRSFAAGYVYAGGQTTFIAPSSSYGLTFNGDNTSGNTLDASAFPSGAVLDGQTGVAQLGLSRDDSFSSIACFVGSSAGSTDFIAPASQLVSSQGEPCDENGSSDQPSFLGTGSGNTLDLSALAASGVSVLTVTPAAGTVDSAAATWDTFADIQSYLGATDGYTTFVAGSTGGLSFTGQGTASTNTMSFAGVPSNGGVQVSLDPNAQGQDTAQPGSGSDTFTGISTVDGSPGTDTFLGGPGEYTIVGGGGAATLSYTDTDTPVSIALVGGTATATGAFPGQTTATGITTFIGSADGDNEFTADEYGGYTFEGPSGTPGNSLSFQNVESDLSVPTLSLTVNSSSGNGAASSLVDGVTPACLVATPPASCSIDGFQGFSSFTGSPFSNSFAVGNGSFTLTAGGTGTNALSFANATSGVTVDLAEATPTATTSGGTVNDNISGFETITGASVGGNTFDAAAGGGYTFVGTTGAGSPNTLNLTAAPSGTVVSANGTSGTVTDLDAGVGPPAGDTTDDYSGIQSVVGSTQPTTIEVGCTGGAAFTGEGGSTLLVLDVTGCGLKPTIDAATTPGTITGLNSSTSDTFTNVSDFEGASSGQTTFVAPGGSSGGYEFTGEGTGNTFDASAFPNGAEIDETSGTATLGLSAQDTFSDVSCVVGSTDGGTTFVAPNGSQASPGCAEHLNQPNFLGSGSGNTLDLQAYSTSSASPLTVTPPTGTVSSGGSTVDTFAGVQGFIGSDSGNTVFVNGSTGGLSFTGEGTAGTNTITFSDVSASGGVSIDLDPNSQGLQTALPGSGTDTFTGITAVDGSPGNDTFTGGPGQWILAGEGGSDALTFSGAPDPLQLSLTNGVADASGGYAGESTEASGIASFVGSSVGNNVFDADAYGGYSFEAPSGSSGNTLSFADVESNANVTGVSVAITSANGNGTASGLNNAVNQSTTDSFQGIQTYIGSNFDDSFTVGSGTFKLEGGSSGKNSVSFASAPSGVTVNLAEPVQAVTTPSGQVDDTISNFETIDGASVGGNTFDAAAAGGYTLAGAGNGNTLDLSATPEGITVTANGDSAGSPGTVTNLSPGPQPPATVTEDTFSGIQSFDGSTSSTVTSPTTFQAGCAGGLSFTGQGRANVLQLSLAGCSGPTPTPEINATTTPGTVAGLPGGGGEDTFTAISKFVGPSAGDTTFVAPGNQGNLDFVGLGGGNTLDASAFPNGATLDATNDATTGTAALGPSESDSFTDMSCFVGSTSGGTDFRAPEAALSAAGCSEHSGTQPNFLATGTGNTLDLSALPTGSSAVATVQAGTVTVGSATWDTYANIQTYLGATLGYTSFVAAAGGGQTFTGQGSSPLTNTLEIPAAPRNTLVDTTSGTVSLGGSTGTLSFSGIGSFVGANGGYTDFKPDALHSYSFTGNPGSSGNTLDLSNAPSGISIDLAVSNSVLISSSPTVEDTFAGIQNYIGSALGSTSFTAPSLPIGGLAFTGQGTGNSLSYASVPTGPGLTIDLDHSTVAYPGWSAGNDSFADIQTMDGSPNADSWLAGPVTMTINGEGGSDTLSFAGANEPANVTLALGSSSGVATGGFITNPAQLTLTGIQNVVSSPFGGTITGNSLPSVFTGGQGNDDFVVMGGADVINGGGGSDTLDLSHATKFVTLNLGLSGQQVTGGAGVLTLVPGSITTVIGGNFGNRLIAGAGNVTLDGGIGSDWLQAGSGTDTLNAGSGTTTLVGGTGYDSMNGGAGVDTFIPGTGGGKIVDTAGVGWLDYALATASVRVNIGTTQYTTPNGTTVLPPDQATGGGGATELLVGLQNIIGTNYGDILVGNTGSNIIEDGNGTNLIVGDGGSDDLSSGSGTNVFVTGSGNNDVSGGSGTNTIDYAGAPAAVTVDLAKSGANAKNGWGGTDSLSGITNIIGSSHSGDVLQLGSGSGGTIVAGDGDGDFLTGAKGGHSTLIGGGGTDSFNSLGPDDHMIGGTGDDDFFGDNGYVDYMTGGSGYNVAFVDCLDVADKTYTGMQEVHEPSGGCSSPGKGGPPKKPIEPPLRPIPFVHPGTPVSPIAHGGPVAPVERKGTGATSTTVRSGGTTTTTTTTPTTTTTTTASTTTTTTAPAASGPAKAASGTKSPRTGSGPATVRVKRAAAARADRPAGAASAPARSNGYRGEGS